jgi:hypothetical protein
MKLDAGYDAMPSGIHVVTVNFHTTFSSPPIVVCTIVDGAIGGSVHINVMPGATTTTSFQVNTSYSPIPFNWVAIGY